MIEWLLGSHDNDVRYWLAQTFFSEEYRGYDRIIIDAPPRLMTASIQALCASHCVIIPTILDGVSVEAVNAFLVQLRKHHQLWPAPLRGLVVPSRTTADVGSIAERDALVRLKAIVARHGDLARIVPKAAFVRSDQLLSRASGERIAYASASQDQAHRELRRNFQNLADALDGADREEKPYEDARIRTPA